VAPLLRFAANVDVAAESFTNKVVRLNCKFLRAARRRTCSNPSLTT
jgi:hypothetical protein